MRKAHNMLRDVTLSCERQRPLHWYAAAEILLANSPAFPVETESHLLGVDLSRRARLMCDAVP